MPARHPPKHYTECVLQRIQSLRAEAAAALVVALIASSVTASLAADARDAPLVPLSSIDSSIIEDIRYATSGNFTGRKVPGYDAPRCLLRPAVAKALARVQADLSRASPPYSLKVFDCYRPERSVKSFMTWAASPEDGTTRHFYPGIARTRLVPKGYIARASTHSRGIAVDLTIAARDGATRDAGAAGSNVPATRPCTDPPAASDGEIDMGTAFDCFDAKSHTWAGGLSDAQHRARATLTRAMARHGFVNYPREWWHFTYPAADDGRSFNVPVR